MTQFRLTDKAETKEVPCAFPGCVHTCIVTKFFTPAKARCPEHQSGSGRSLPTSLAQTAAPLEPPSGTLTNLACPNHPDTRMKLVASSNRFEEGVTLQLQCPECFLVVTLTTSFRKMITTKDGEPYEPSWHAWLKGREDKHGNRIAAFRAEEEPVWVSLHAISELKTAKAWCEERLEEVNRALAKASKMAVQK